MPIPAILLLTAALLPLVAFVLLVFMGRRFGTPLAGFVGTGLIAASFICSMLAMIDWYGGGTTNGQVWGFERGPINLPIHWLPIGSASRPSGFNQETAGWLDVGIFVDSLTIAMFAMITMVAMLVHIFSLGYMQEDGRYPRFFAFLGLFCFSMLGLVIGGTLLHILIFWELIGLCSFLLIGFRFENKSAIDAALKSFLSNRIGDCGLLIGLGILFYHLGNTTFPHLWILLGKAGTGHAIGLPDGTVFSTGMLTVTGIGLFCGAIGKSAQFPLHSWLIDAVEAPIPASAMTHAAATVTAGVYLLGRIFPILTPNAKLFIAVIGVVTLTIGAWIAVAQTDIRKVLAFSTMSQLGYMMLGMGVGSWVGSLFHLITHGFFKTLLFLGAGSVIRAARHRFEMTEFGRLARKIPFGAFTFLIGVLAISGVGFSHFGLSGYYSLDMILTHAGAFAALGVRLGHSQFYWALFALPVIAAYLTPFYMMRCWTMTFWGKPRVADLYDNAREWPMMWVTLLVLAGLAIISGRWIGVQEMIEGSLHEDTNYCRQFDFKFGGFETVWPTSVTADPVDISPSGPLAAGRVLVDKYLGFRGFGLGIPLALLIYFRGVALATWLSKKIPPIGWIRRWLYNRMYLDELYSGLSVAVILSVARLAARIDRIFGTSAEPSADVH